MQYRTILIGAILLFLAAIGAACQTVANPSLGASAGILPAAEFAQFYEDNNGETLMGSARTALFWLPAEEKWAQYFDRMRLEYDPDLDQIAITPLGAYFYQGDTVAEGAINDEFLAFYQTNGGPPFFGKPISPQLIEADRYVQYFENVMLEWHPETPERLVQVAELGNAHFIRSGAREAYRDQLSVNAIPVPEAGLTGLALESSVTHPILFGGDEQAVWARVSSPAGVPIAGQNVEVTAFAQSGELALRNMAETDETGMARIEIEMPDSVAPGQSIRLNIQVDSESGGQTINQILHFQLWW